MKTLFYILLSLLLTHSINSKGVNYTKLQNGGYVNILGSTNINKFTFGYTIPSDKDLDLHINFVDENKISFVNTLITIPIQEFDSGNSIMNEDFYELLARENRSEISIGIDTLSLLEYIDQDNKINALAGVTISLAGVTKSYKTRLFFEQDEYGNMRVKGTQMIDIGEFGITPPEKFFGLIKTATNVIVEFQFIFIF